MPAAGESAEQLRWPQEWGSDGVFTRGSEHAAAQLGICHDPCAPLLAASDLLPALTLAQQAHFGGVAAFQVALEERPRTQKNSSALPTSAQLVDPSS